MNTYKYIGLAIVTTIFFCGCNKDKIEDKLPIQKGFVISNEMMKTTTVEKVQNDFVETEMSFYGKISADKNQYIDIYPLATIRSTEVAGFQKDLSDARTEVAVAENNLRVAQDLYSGKLNTEKDVLEAKSQLQKANDELRRSQSVNQVYNIKNGNIYSVIAPISGYIVQKNINKDMQLRSDRSDNIFDVANTNNVWAIVNINESDINKVSLGMKAKVSTLANPSKIFTGTIDKIFKIIDPETNAMQARVVLENATGQLIPESKATIKVLKTENTRAISIPKEALIFDDNRYFVVVFKSQSNVKIQEVKLDKETGSRAYISEGLLQGDQVITNNQLFIYRALSE